MKTLYLIIYILSIIGMRWAYRLQSPKHWNTWSKERCGFHIFWIIPLVNTIALFMLILLGYTYKEKRNQSKSKIFNGDITNP